MHEVAQAIDPLAKIVYVDNDPIVLAHAHALLTGTPGTVSYIDADIRDTSTIVREAARTLDLSQPVAILLLMTLQFITDDHDPYHVVATLLEAVPSGSFLAISHPAADISEAANHGTRRYNELVSVPMTRRSHEEIARFFAGLELIEPGVVELPHWRTDRSHVAPNHRRIPAYAALGRKP